MHEQRDTIMASLTSNEACLKCGSPLGRFAPGRVCARCLLEAGLSDSAFDDGAGDGQEPDADRQSAPNLGRFGRYELLEEIGHGGMGVVYRARDTRLNRVVALKMILAGQFASEREVRRFRAEAEAVARLDHPNIVPIYEVGEQDGRPFYSMKFMEGGTLTERLAARTAPPAPREAASLLVRIARAVHHAHQRAILHRDLKPGNILLDAQGEPHVSDFGLAKCLDSTDGLTLSGATVGSPNYMSPEQAAGQSERLTTASDTYSLGALLYQLLTGSPPFEAATPLATMKRVMEEEPRRPSALNSAVDRDLETVCLKCLEKDPQVRYPSADALAEELERWLRHEPIRARPSAAAERLGKWIRRNPRVATLVVLLNLVFIIGLGGILIVSVRLASANRAKEQVNAQLGKNVRDFEWQKIDELIATGKRADALAYLSAFLRRDPNDRAAANRLVSMLSECNFALPTITPLQHGAGVTMLEPSKDGRRVLTATDDGKARIWDLGSGRATCTLVHPLKVSFASFAADERLVLTTCQDGTSRLWDVTDGKVLFEFPKGVAAQSGVASPDRGLFAMRETDVAMQVWDLMLRKRVGGSLSVPSTVRWAVFSPDSRNIAVASSDGTVRVWAVEHSEELTAPMKLGGDITRVEFSPDGQTLAIAWGGSITLWNPHSGVKLKEFKAHDGQVLQIEFSPDGRRFVSMAYDQALKIWDVASGQTLGQPIEAERPFGYFHFSPDGKKLATRAQNGVARLWDALTGRPLSEPFEHEGPLTDLRFSSNGQYLLTASQDGAAKVWEAQATPPEAFTVKTTDVYPCACFDREGRRVFCATASRVEMYDTVTKQHVGKPMTHSAQVYRMKLSPDGKKLATAGWDNMGRVWDAQTGEPLTPPLPHRWRLFAIAFSPDNHLVATGSADGTARLWNAETGHPVGPELQHQDQVKDVQFRPDSGAVLTASLDGTARLWSTGTGQALWTEPVRHKGIVWSAEFSPDGRRVVTASADRSAIVWDALSRQPMIRPLAHERGVLGAHFSPDGKRVLTCSEDGTARVWDAATGEPVSQPMRHKDKLGHAEFSPDGRLILTGSQDGTARLWDALTGYPVSEPLKHDGQVTGIQFSPDGKRCLSIANSDRLRVWDVTDAPVAVPAWFCDLVEAVAGKRLNAHRDAEYVGRQSVQSFRNRFRDSGRPEFYSRWAHWFLHERLKEPVPPFDPHAIGQTARH